MDWVIELLRREWRVIRLAPWSFVAALFACTVVAMLLIWFFMDWGYGRQIALLQERVAAYSDKLNGATPDEAAKKIKNLEDQITILKVVNNPKIEDLGHSFEKLENDGWIFRITIDVASKFTPNGVLLEFHSKGITGFDLKPQNALITESGKYGNTTDEYYGHYIQKPFGHYELDLKLKERALVKFDWMFDGGPGGSIVAR